MTKSKQQPTESYLKADEVGEMLSISTNTLACWRSCRKGPDWVKFGYGKGAFIRYPLSDLQGWIENQRAGSGFDCR